MAKKYTYEQVKETIEEMGGELISTEYKDSRTKLKILCSCCKTNIFEVNFTSYKNKVMTKCPECVKKESSPVKWNYDLVKTFVEENGGKLISKKYVDVDTKMAFVCNVCGKEEFITSFYNYNKLNKRACNKCKAKESKKKISHTYDYVKNYIESNSDCKLISTEYIDCKTPLILTCGNLDCQKEFNCTFNDFRRGKHLCRTCSNNKKGQDLPHTHSYDEIHDYFKNRGVKLISKSYKNIYTELKAECPLCKKEFEISYISALRRKEIMCEECKTKTLSEIKRYNINDVIEYINKNSSCELLSTTYEGENSIIKLKCDCGNEYETTYALFRGSRTKKCSECRGYINWDIDKIREYVKENSDCELLSTEYKETHSKLDFKCACGNEFSVAWHDFYDETVLKRQCNECSNDSVLETTASKILNKYNVDYNCQQTFLDCRNPETGRKLRYDFYLPAYNLILETHGYQHDHVVKFCSTITDEEAELDFIKRKERDKFKEEYAIKNNYDFMIIWYYEIKEMEQILTTKLKLN